MVPDGCRPGLRVATVRSATRARWNPRVAREPACSIYAYGAPKGIHGKTSQYERPTWQPLLDLLGDELVGDFMWMHEIELATGERVHAYKHIDTRRYIHLGEGGRAYLYLDGGEYRTIPAIEAADLALPRGPVPPNSSGFRCSRGEG